MLYLLQCASKIWYNTIPSNRISFPSNREQQWQFCSAFLAIVSNHRLSSLYFLDLRFSHASPEHVLQCLFFSAQAVVFTIQGTLSNRSSCIFWKHSSFSAGPRPHELSKRAGAKEGLLPRCSIIPNEDRNQVWYSKAIDLLCFDQSNS